MARRKSMARRGGKRSAKGSGRKLGGRRKLAVGAARMGTIVNGGASPLGKTHKTTLRYVTNITLDSAAGIPDFYTFNANSIFDPDRTGGGHRPLGTSEWHKFYEYATVTGCRIRCVAANGVGATEAATMFGYLFRDLNAGLPIGVDTLREQPNSAVAYLAINQGMTSNSIAGKLDIAQFVGKTRAQIVGVDEYSTKVGSQATLQAHAVVCDLWCSALDLASDASLEVAVHLEYDVTFSGPVPLPTSS